MSRYAKRNPVLARVYAGKLWKDTAAAILQRDGYTCSRCHGPGNSVHHIVAMEEGGAPYAWDNLTTLCTSCHSHTDNMRLLGKGPEPFVPKVNRFMGTVLSRPK